MADKKKFSERYLAKTDRSLGEVASAGPGPLEKSRISVEVLNRIRQGMPTPQLLKEVVNLLSDRTGFEAVGLRLREGDDYPYFQTRGMSEEFIRLENSLCPKRQQSSVEQGDGGGFTLDCACGAVIQGRIDHSYPFVTEYGSIWTNSNTQLLLDNPQFKEAIRGDSFFIPRGLRGSTKKRVASPNSESSYTRLTQAAIH